MDKDIITAAIGIVPALLTCFITVWVFMMNRQLKAVHTLVNSNMGIQLKLNADNSRWRADISKKKTDIKAAEEAEVLLQEHERNQAIVDKENQKEK